MTDAQPPRLLWWGTLGTVAALLLFPLVLVDVPPLLDYPNHLARLYVLAHPHDPVLARFYAQRWSIVPDLTIDLLAPPLLRVLPVYAAGRVVVAVTLLLPVLGCAAYHRALFGHRSLWPLAAGLIACNAVFILGFLNFQITLGLALLVAAGWRAWSHRWPARSAAGGAIAATGLFFSHIFGLVFFAVLVGAGELAGLRAARRGQAPLIRYGARRTAMLAVMFGGPAALYLLAPLSGTASGRVGWLWLAKLHVALSPFAHYWNAITFITAAAVLLAVYLLARAGCLRVGAGTGIAMLVLVLAYVVMPTVLLDTAFVDTRIPIMVALLLFAGCAPAAVPRRTGAVVAAVLAIAMLLRSGATSIVWLQQAHDIAALRATIASVQPGDRVLAAGVEQDSNPAYWSAAPANRVLPGYMRLNAHLPALLLIDRRAFWPLLFTDPTKQPVVVRPPYDRISAPHGWLPELRQLADPRLRTPGRDNAYLANWQADFDYLLLMDPRAADDPAAVLPGRLTLVTGNDVAALYRIRRPPPK